MSSSGSSSSSPDVLTAVVLGVGVGGGFVIVPALVLILGMFGVLMCGIAAARLLTLTMTDGAPIG